jgi:hypothetical protein
LPADIQDLADTTYDLWHVSPFHTSLHFKHLGDHIWSVRIEGADIVRWVCAMVMKLCGFGLAHTLITTYCITIRKR